MLKHCQSSSVRLQRRYNNLQADSVSLNSTVTIRSNGESSDSSLNSSFNINSNDPNEIFNVRNALFERAVHYGCATPDPISLSSRASSYCSLTDSGPKTAIKVFASCLRPDIEYKTLSIGNSTTARDIIWQLLSKYRMKHRDPKLFFLTMEVVIQKPGRDGLTKKTLVLEDDSKPAELKNCNPWGECRFTLQMRKGGLVKVHDSVLMEESQYKCLLISEETSVEDVIKILLYCYGLEKIERADRYCMYEQCSSQRYQRKLSDEDRPLAIQGLWPGPTPFSFVLRRSPLRIEDNVWSKQRSDKLSEKMNTPPQPRHHHGHRSGSWPAVSEWSTQTDDRLLHIQENNVRHTHRMQQPDRDVFQAAQKRREAVDARLMQEKFPDCSRILRDEDDSWPEVDKDSEEVVSSSGEDMDTSLSSNDSPTPPLTSTPLCLQPRPRPPALPLNKPTMSFLYPSPDYESFPNKLVPSRPYSSQSVSSLVAGGPAPSLPPKPASLVSLFSKNESTGGNLGPRVYENYFYI